MLFRQYLILAGAALALLTGGIFVKNYLAAQKKPQNRRAIEAPPTNVEVFPVRYGEQETELKYFGRLGSFASVELISEVQGRILAGAYPLKPGQNFRKGQLVFRIDDREARLSLQSQKSSFQKSLADILADIKVDYPDRFPVWEAYFKSIDPEQSLPDMPEVTDLTEKTFFSTRNIFSSYYNIRAQEERLTKYRTYAPFSGSLSQVQLEAGSVANPGTRVATLIRTDRLEMVIPVAPGDLQWLSPGTKVTVSPESGEKSYEGSISRIGELVDAGTQSVNVYVGLQATSTDKPIPGQYLKAVLPGKVVRQAMEIPRSALFNERFAYSVKDSSLQKVELNVHKLNPNTAIVSGVPENTLLVKEVPLNAVDGLDVKVEKQ